MTCSAVHVSNNILSRAFRDGVEVTPMKLQRLLYFTASDYAKRAGEPLLNQRFVAWEYGPVLSTVWAKFRCYDGTAILRLSGDAAGRKLQVDETRDVDLRESIDQIWSSASTRSAVELSRVTHLEGSAWRAAWNRGLGAPILEEDLGADISYLQPLGIPTTRSTKLREQIRSLGKEPVA